MLTDKGIEYSRIHNSINYYTNRFQITAICYETHPTKQPLCIFKPD